MQQTILFDLGDWGADNFKRIIFDFENQKCYIQEGQLVWTGGGYQSTEKRTPISFDSLKNYAQDVSESLFIHYKSVDSENWQSTLPQIDSSKILICDFKYRESDAEKSYIYLDKNTGAIFLSKYNSKYFAYIDYDRFEVIRERFLDHRAEKYKGIHEANWKNYLHK